ncbi:MAG: response regulator [Pedosphaera sp.]|nr:response regulator [Pedosphaera sp.]
MNPDAVDLLPPRILIVDDERQIHASLRLRLGRDYDLAFCFDAREALEKIAHERFDLCLADIHMPHLDGLAFIEAARQVDPGLGFVVLSAFDTDENLRRAIPLQVYEFLSKPLPERHEFEGREPDWVEQTRRRRRDQALAQQSGTIAGERDSAQLEREVELVASETARDALRQTASLLTTIQAHLVAATTVVAARARTDPSVGHLLRNLEEARKTTDAVMTVAEGFFDSAYGSRDTSPALINEGIRHAINIAVRMSRAEDTSKVVDFSPLDDRLPVQGLSGIDFLLMLVPALGAALTLAPANTTVGIHGEHFSRLEAVPREPRWRGHLWLNRKHALNGHAGVLLTVTASAPPLSRSQLEAWLKGEYIPLATVTSRGLLAGVRKCRGLLGMSLPTQAGQFQLVLALPT